MYFFMYLESQLFFKLFRATIWPNCATISVILGATLLLYGLSQ